MLTVFARRCGGQQPTHTEEEEGRRGSVSDKNLHQGKNKPNDATRAPLREQYSTDDIARLALPPDTATHKRKKQSQNNSEPT